MNRFIPVETTEGHGLVDPRKVDYIGPKVAVPHGMKGEEYVTLYLHGGHTIVVRVTPELWEALL